MNYLELATNLIRKEGERVMEHQIRDENGFRKQNSIRPTALDVLRYADLEGLRYACERMTANIVPELGHQEKVANFVLQLLNGIEPAKEQGT